MLLLLDVRLPAPSSTLPVRACDLSAVPFLKSQVILAVTFAPVTLCMFSRRKLAF